MATKKRLGEMLVEAGIIDDSQLLAALRHQRQWGGRLGAILIELKLASEEAIVDALALKFGFEIARLDRIEPYAFEQAKGLVPREYAVRNRIFPMAADTGVLVVAMSDPTNLALTDELAFKTGRRIKVCIAGEHAVGAAIRAHFGDDGSSGQREAIALGPDDDTAMEPVYDPIGATSNEQMVEFFEQPAAPLTAVAARPGKPAPKAATPAPPPASDPAAGGPHAQAPGSARDWSRSPAVLQLEDQPTGSIPLLQAVPAELSEEELQSIEPEGEPTGEFSPEAGVAAASAARVEAGAYGEAAYADAQGAQAQAAEAGAEPDAPPRPLTDEEVEILAALDRLARGDDTTPSVVSPTQLLAALIRLMMRKQWITEHELLDEILRG